MFTNGFEEGNKSISIFARWTLEEIQRGVIHADFEGLKFAAGMHRVSVLNALKHS